jgi:hypothetical protein
MGTHANENVQKDLKFTKMITSEERGRSHVWGEGDGKNDGQMEFKLYLFLFVFDNELYLC